MDKDRSLDSLIAGEHQHLEPLSDFRHRLKQVSSDPECRSKLRRNGMPGLGPLTMAARKILLDELLAIQAATGEALISVLEVRLIREQWNLDESTERMRSLASSAINSEEMEESLQPL